MTYRVDIPESVAQSLRLPESEIQSRLRSELALALYAQGILDLGKASELAGVSRLVFAAIASQRNIPLHYTEDELTQDLEYARGQ